MTPQEKEKDECFKVEILQVDGGAKLGRIKRAIITIVNDDGEMAFWSRHRNPLERCDMEHWTVILFL